MRVQLSLLNQILILIIVFLLGTLFFIGIAPISRIEKHLISIKENQVPVEVIVEPEVIEEKPIHNMTFTELKKYVNKIHSEKEVTIYSATIDYSRKIEQYKRLMIAIGEPNPRDFAHLLAFIEQVESNGGRFTLQQGGGGAVSAFQIEYATYKDMLHRVIPKHPNIAQVLQSLEYTGYVDGIDNLENNHMYAAVVAYTIIKSRYSIPPNYKDKVAQAEVHKKFYNTDAGATEIHESVYKTMGM